MVPVRPTFIRLLFYFTRNLKVEVSQGDLLASNFATLVSLKQTLLKFFLSSVWNYQLWIVEAMQLCKSRFVLEVPHARFFFSFAEGVFSRLHSAPWRKVKLQRTTNRTISRW